MPGMETQDERRSAWLEQQIAALERRLLESETANRGFCLALETARAEIDELRAQVEELTRPKERKR